jgi:hypothetical protein
MCNDLAPRNMIGICRVRMNQAAQIVPREKSEACAKEVIHWAIFADGFHRRESRNEQLNGGHRGIYRRALTILLRRSNDCVTGCLPRNA